MMRGWKTWAGASLVGCSAALEYLGHRDISTAIAALGVALGLVGLGHKIEKTGRAVIPVRRGPTGRFARIDK